MNAHGTNAINGMMLAVMLGACGVVMAGSDIHQTLDPPQITVGYSELNLNTEAGTKVLYSRIRAAARKVCGPPFADWYPGQRPKSKSCYQATVEHAIRAVNRPMLTALRERQVRVADR
ncbi:MAG: UrcA family protein [Gammaproteobacteria bacterium]